MAEKYLEFEQDGVKYNLYDMPKGFIIKGDLELINKGLTELPDLSEVIVEGSFDCSKNKLTTLKGAPKEVGGDFKCFKNQLTTLEGAPNEVGGDFKCFKNQLTTLEGAPNEVGGHFTCSRNKLITLKGAPREVGGYFGCSENELTTLKGAPKEVVREFSCDGNRLKSLLHLPKIKEEGRIYCDDELAQKYGISKGEFTANELNESSLYQNEVKIYKLRLQKSQERAEKQEQATKDIRAKFAAWQARQTQKDGPEK
ncbi:MAG: hypothetical protein IJ770_05445 [Alphaproteobacteria bacterium]|nr:hypothetical protein [Alphaproteobacteria bacterium]